MLGVNQEKCLYQGKKKEGSNLEWKVTLWKLYPWKAVFLVIFLIVLWLGIYFVFNLWGFVLSVILIGGNVLPFWLPTSYKLDENGITIKGLLLKKEKRWGEFKSYYKDKIGVLLSPFPTPTRLENFRGTYIRFNNNEKKVMEVVQKYIK